MHGVTGFVESAALLVFAAFVLVTICSRISVPSIVGYILAGIIIGPAGLGLIAESAALSSIGEIGVVLLLFALGLEFSFEKIVTLRKHVFGLGAVQVAVTTITVSLVASLIFDLAPLPAILIAGPLPCHPRPCASRCSQARTLWDRPKGVWPLQCFCFKTWQLSHSCFCTIR